MQQVNKENYPKYYSKGIRKILRVGKCGALNQSPNRKGVESKAQQSLEALSQLENQKQNVPFMTLQENNITGWDDEELNEKQIKQQSQQKIKNTSVSTINYRYSQSSQGQRRNRSNEIRQKTPKTPLHPSTITSPLYAYPTIKGFKFSNDKTNNKHNLQRIIGLDCYNTIFDGLNSFSFNNFIGHTKTQKKNNNIIYTQSSNKKTQVTIIKDINK